MAQYVTLDEAAQKLGIPPDDFKRRLKTEWTHVVPMRDGPTLRFRVAQVEELARQLGAASDPALPLADPFPSPGSSDFRVPGPGRDAGDEPLVFEGSDDDIFSLTEEPAAGKKPGRGGDSDVRLEAPGRSPRPGGGSIPTEEIVLDLAGPGSAVIKGGSGAKLPPPSSAKLSAPDSGKNLAGGLGSDAGQAGDSSEFELSLDADSDDFELRLNADSSDEVDLGSSPVETGGGKSGIRLSDPKDSGIPLDAGGRSGSKGAAKESDPDLDFELTLDPGPASGARLSSTGPKSGGNVPVTSDSDSEFELTLDGSSGSGSLEGAALESAEANKGDIFETDFEIPPMADESGSEAVAVDSDTDLEVEGVADEAGDETGSQVVVLEDDSEAVAAPVEDLEVEDEPAAVAPRTLTRAEDEPATVPAAALRPRPWGVLPALILFPTVVLTLLGSLMAFEVLRSATGYNQPRKPAAPLVRGVADTFGFDLKDQ